MEFGENRSKVLILTNSNPYKKAGILATYLFKGFENMGYNTKLLVKEYGDYQNKNIISIENKRDKVLNDLKNKIIRTSLRWFNLRKQILVDPDYAILNYDLTTEYYKTRDILKKANFKPDVIIYLFPQKFLNAKNLYELNQITGAPIFWYLMDSAALTGGCHYFWSCTNYKLKCGNCPGMYSNHQNDQSSNNLSFKNYYLSKTDISIIVGTSRMFAQVKESALFKDKLVYNIPLPVDHTVFKPTTLKAQIRINFGIPQGRRIVFFGAGSLESKRKGMVYLVEALKLIRKNYKELDLFLLVAGSHFEYIKNDLPFDYKYFGLLDNDEQLASVYQISDVFICPSIEEAGPLMINQSIISGTPVVSFDMGIAGDLIINGKTGYIVKLFDIENLAKRIVDILILKDNELEIMSENCRDLGLKLLKQDKFVNEFERIFAKR